MKFNLQLPVANNQGQLFVEASSIEEFNAVRDYLKEQGLFGVGTTRQAAPVEKDAAAQEVKKEAEAPKAEKPAAKKEAAAKKETPKAEPKADAKAAADAKTAAGPTIEEVTAVLSKVADTFGVPEALAMNQRFGVRKAGELKPEQYPEYVRFAQHCLDDNAKPTDAHPDFDGSGEAAEDDVSSLV